MRRLQFLLLAGLCSLALPAHALEWPKVRLTGFIQPGFEYIASDPGSARSDGAGGYTADSRLGFTAFRARALALGEWTTGPVTFDFRLEVEGLPQPNLYDAYIDAKGPTAGGGYWRVIAGQHKAPFSRQILVWDPDLQFAGTGSLGVQPGNYNSGKAFLTELAPGHQVGLTLMLNVPYAPWVQVYAGVYNGEGRNTVENVDKNFMYVARLALRPWGALQSHVESAHGDKQLSFAANVSYNTLDKGDYDQKDLLIGADAFIAWRGLSAYAEFLWGKTTYAGHNANVMVPAQDHNELGYNAQAGYLLPIPGYLYRRFEVVGRFQGLVRNNVVALANIGDLNQAFYDVVAGINYYQFAHSLKAMVNYHHLIWPADPARQGKAWSSDALYVVLSYRLE